MDKYSIKIDGSMWNSEIKKIVEELYKEES
jgi:hypothetical protein